MAKIEQALILYPPMELHFKAPFTDITTSYLNLTNPTDRDICFKVKTTAPKTYCVRPNSGTINPKKTVSVAVMLQPLDLESADKSRHKFMVQSIFAPEGEYSLEALWRDTPQDNFMNSKLKCVFDIPAEPTQPAAEQAEPSKVEVKTSQVQEVTLKDNKTAVMDEDQHQSVGKHFAQDAEAEANLQKLQNSHKRLQSELNDVRQENLVLKEEGLRSRVAYDRRSRGTSAKSVETEVHNISAKQQIVFSNFFIGLAIIIFLCGLYLGKYIL